MESTNFINALKLRIAHFLPGEMAHIPMAPTNRPMSSFALKKTDEYRVSSVAIVLFEEPFSAQIHCILIQRPDYEGAHSGQISFPGGKKDETDPNSEFTARRECFEEIGCILTQDQLLGKLTDVFIPVSKFLIHPYLYFYTGDLNFQPDEREVSEIITFSLPLFLKDECISRMDIHLPNNAIMPSVPCFQFEQKKVWGATALILNELRELILRLT